jgi:hypothetical protein
VLAYGQRLFPGSSVRETLIQGRASERGFAWTIPR